MITTSSDHFVNFTAKPKNLKIPPVFVSPKTELINRKKNVPSPCRRYPDMSAGTPHNHVWLQWELIKVTYFLLGS